MELSGATYVLTAAQFEREVTRPGGDVAWRRTQVRRVLDSFEESKKEMSNQGVEEVYKYLTNSQWIQDSRKLSEHSAYRRFVGTGRHSKSLYYGHFFVLQAIFVTNGGKIGDAVERMYDELSGHWGKLIPHDKPFYPRLADSEKERRLIMGNYQWRNDQAGKQDSDAIQGKITAHSNINNNSTNSDKQKALDRHLRAAAQLSAELNDEAQEAQRRETDWQRMRGELRTLRQQNLDLKRQVQERSNLLQNAENKLEEKEGQLRDTQRQLITSREYASALENYRSHMRQDIGQYQQLSIEIQEVDEQRKAKSSMMQQCINNMARRGLSQIEGSNAATKRPAAENGGGEEPKRPRQG
ncbi:hypothetical protein F52700_5797 [Fusarium sp. NRRL 52700]|nr:hypothetical protein F52700_5797 [Fusarium sp. NRRL 52700]